MQTAAPDWASMMGDQGDAGAQIRKFRFHYQKGRYFRVIHADGAFGGIAPSGNLHFALYNERKAIPKETEIEVTEDGPQTEKTIDSLEGFVREIETDVVMDINAALNLHKWLGTKLEALRQALKISDEEWDKMRNGTE